MQCMLQEDGFPVCSNSLCEYLLQTLFRPPHAVLIAFFARLHVAKFINLYILNTPDNFRNTIYYFTLTQYFTLITNAHSTKKSARTRTRTLITHAPTRSLSRLSYRGGDGKPATNLDSAHQILFFIPLQWDIMGYNFLIPFYLRDRKWLKVLGFLYFYFQQGLCKTWDPTRLFLINDEYTSTIFNARAIRLYHLYYSLRKWYRSLHYSLGKNEHVLRMCGQLHVHQS